jgi:spermidine/putrescine transport system substrate-binding protein
MNPKEGILTYCCGLVLTANARNIDQAYDLIDAMIAPEAGKWLIEANGYGHSNAKSFEIIDPKKLEELNLPADPIAFLNNGIVYKTMQRLDVVSQMFESVKASI